METAKHRCRKDGPVTSLVFPTYNPGEILDRTWAGVEHFLHHAPGNWEVLFVCDGCTDGSPERLRALSRSEAHQVRVLSYAPNRGKGFAVRHGLQAARGQWRLFTDVDLAYGFDDVLRVVEALQNGSDVVIGSRTHPESQLTLPTRLQGYVYRRHLQSLIFSALVRRLLPLSQCDTQAGLKGLSAAAAEKVLPLLTCSGFGFDCELLTACVCHGLAIREVPVRVHYEDRISTTNWITMGRMLREIWQVRRTWRQLQPIRTAAPGAPARRAA
jgi:dolichyl-phosphate beta-glucosyltransferase